MGSNERRPTPLEAHQTERRVADTLPSAWPGEVRVSTAEGVLLIPGTWHLEVPGAGRPLATHGRASLPLPLPADLLGWRDHLMRLITLQVPGMQLRVTVPEPQGRPVLELAAPTTPISVVHVDPGGLRAVLGPQARVSLGISAA